MSLIEIKKTIYNLSVVEKYEVKQFIDSIIEVEDELTILNLIRLNADMSVRLKTCLINLVDGDYNHKPIILKSEINKKIFLKLHNAGVKTWKELESFL